MNCTCDLGYQYIEVEETVTAPSNDVCAFSVSIPLSKSVVGSGVFIGQIESGGTYYTESTFPSGDSAWLISATKLYWTSGPDPSDSTKWKFYLNTIGVDQNNFKVKLWITVVEP